MLIPTTADHQVQIASLAGLDASILDMPLVNVTKQTDSRQLLRPVYTWDNYELAKRLGMYTQNGYELSNPTWNPVWCDKYSQSTGSDVYIAVETPFAVAPFVHPRSSSQKTNADISFPPLVTVSRGLSPDYTNVYDSETHEGQLELYRAAIYPSWPVMLASTVDVNKYYGPLIMSSMKLSVSGLGRAQRTSASYAFMGGKSLHVTAPSRIEFALNESSQEHVYRAASVLDCVFVTELFNDRLQLLDYMQSYEMPIQFASADQRLVSMSLSINQSIQLNVVCHADSLKWSDEDGPRFTSVKSRVVSGELVFYGKSSEPIEPTKAQATMYFGGPFLFSMPNIVWQRPTTSESPSGGYTHTYAFLAYAAPNAVMLNKKSYEDYNTVSEFLIPSNISGEIYEPQ